MRTSKPTAVKEDYLRAIFRLAEASGSVKSVDVARYLGLSRSTVSERMNELADQGYVTHAAYGQHIAFTRRGGAAARKLTHKHRMIEVFLCDVLRLSKKEAHEEAHRLEHALSDKVIRKLGRFLGNPKVDPHGSPIPRLG